MRLNDHPKGYFITGTDTEVGKTYIATLVIHALRTQHKTKPIVGLKPVASGCLMTPEGLRNEDAIKLQSVSSHQLPYHQVNPYAFAPPIAPNIAAEQVGRRLCISDLLAKHRTLEQRYPNTLWVVEGVGGWAVPLNSQETMGDFARALNMSVILVIGIKLGCLNHAYLTYQALRAANVTLVGWIANQPSPIEPMAYNENIATLKQMLNIPLLKVVPYKYKEEST